MTQPRLSVLLPCRDAAEHLPLAIRCLEQQTYQNFEVIAVNDGSRDDTPDVLDDWAAHDARVRVVHKEGEGLARTLQVGSGICGGELLARVDADDVMHPRRLAEQVALLNARPEVAATGTRVRYFPWEAVGWGARRYQSWLNDLVEPEQLARDIFVECPISHPTLMVRRSAFNRVGGYLVNGWPEDYDLILRLHLSGAGLANVPRVLHYWREGEGRASRSDPRYSAQAFRRCKIHYLRQGVLEGRGTVNIWGAGRVGKDFARALADKGLRVASFFDIDPRKIGQEIHGAAVRPVDDVTRHREHYLLVAVGSPGAREMIREELTRAGFEEPREYCCVA